MIRILLVDDQNMVRQGLQALVADNPKLKIVGHAVNGQDALEQVAKYRPDIVLIDIEMPKMNGIVATQKICEQFPQTKVIVLSSHENVEYVTQSIQVGAKGYLLKQALFEDVERAIELVERGYSQIESQLLTKVVSQTNLTKTQPDPTQKNRLKVYRQNALHSSSELQVKSLAGNTSCWTKFSGQNKSNESQHLFPPEDLTIIPRSDSSKTEPSKTEPSKTEPAISESLSPQMAIANKPDKITSDDQPQPPKSPQRNKLFWSAIGLILALTGLIMVVAWWRLANRPDPQLSLAPTYVGTQPPKIKTVVALGRIEPLGQVISLSAPTSLEAVQVKKLLVQEDQRVEAGQLIAILDGRRRLQASLDETTTGVQIAQARLEQVKAGAKPSSILAKEAAIANLQAELAGETQTQQSTIAKATAQLNNARSELQRHQMLHEQGAISASELDSKRLTANTAEEQLKEAQGIFERTRLTLEARIQEAIALLAETKEVRDVDLQIAQAELNQAQAAVGKAQSDMELAYVRTPIAGVILAVHARPGEAPDQKGIVEIGRTEQMTVIAEVDQNDIKRVKIGQKATLSSGVFDEQLEGKVHQIGSMIGKNDILDTDPTADEDTRVVEVQILLEPEASRKVTKLTNLEVDVTIEV